MGEDAISDGDPVMGGEDFSAYQRAGVPSVLIWVGAVDPSLLGDPANLPPSTHSPLFAPVPEPTIRAATTALATSALTLFRDRR
jgi:hippurate hydrolase